MSKTAKPAAPQATDTPPPKKSKKKLIIIIVLILLLAGGGAAAFLSMKPSPPASPDEAGAAAEEAHPEAPPAYVQLGTFTANLIHEEGDRYLQVAIDLKITKPELAEKIKATNPEILHRINMLLQSKRPSELASFEGKQKLAEQIKAQVEYVLGLRKTPPAIADADATPDKEAPAAQSSPDAAPTGTHAGKSGIADVLFTSFIIQ
jgi:flagellar FliL protein